MRQGIRVFLHIVANTLPIVEPIYEFGACQVPGQEKLANLRDIFPNKQYIGCDIKPGPGVDKMLNLHHIDLPDNTAGTVLIMDTLEHVEFPHKAMGEAQRILKPNGLCIISSVLNFPIHCQPDYWRFTTDGFSSLLQYFDWRLVRGLVSPKGDPLFYHTVIGVGGNGSKPHLNKFIKKLESGEQNKK